MKRILLIASPALQAGAGLSPTLTLPQNLATVAPTLQEDFEDYTEWTAAVGSFTIQDDALNVFTGSHAVQITGLAVGQNSIQKTVSWDLSASSGHFFFRVYASVDCSTDSLQIYLANAAFTSYWAWTVGNLKAGRNIFHAIAADWTAAGGMTWATPVEIIRLRYNNNHAVNPTLSYDSLYVGGTFKPAILMEFDDGFDGVISHAYPSMQSLHSRATTSVISDLIGVANYMTLADLQTLDAAGWSVINHTQDHTYLTTQTEAKQEAALSACDAALETMDADRRKHVTYPNGLWNADTLTALAALGMHTGRTILEGNIPLLPAFDNYRLRIHGISETTTLAVAEGYVDSVKARSEVVIFLFHQLVVENPGVNEWTQANYDALVQYIVAAGVPLITRHDLYQLQSGPVEIPNPAYQV